MRCPKCEFTIYLTEEAISAHRTRFYDDDPASLLPPFCPVCGHSFSTEGTDERREETLALSKAECLDVPIAGEILPQYWWVIHLMAFGEEIVKNWDDSYMEYAQKKRNMLVQVAEEIFSIGNKYVALDEQLEDEARIDFLSEDVSQRVKSDIESSPLIVASGAFSNVVPKDTEREAELKSHPRNYVVFYLMEALDILIHEAGIQAAVAVEGGNATAALEAVDRMGEYWTAYFNLLHFFTEIEDYFDLDPDAYQDNLWLLFNHLATRVGYMDDLDAMASKGDDSFDNYVQIMQDILHNDIVMVYDEILNDGTPEENLLAADWYRNWRPSKYYPKDEYLMMINTYVEDGWDHLEKLAEYVEKA